MPNKSIELPPDEIIISLENATKTIPGFVTATISHGPQGQFAKALASGFLKFTVEGKRLSQMDSVQSFIELADLHRDLMEQAHIFLCEEVPFVYEDQPIQPLLLNFAAYRLKQVSRRYYYATLQNQPQAILEDLKMVIQQRQEEYDSLLQYV